ncbi:MAG: hypothetical protein AMXMBFR23_15500 [Chloroflexota bacterium]
MTDQPQRATQAIGWLLRQPFHGEREVGRLLGCAEHDARHLLQELTRRGCVDWVEPGSPDLERRRRYFVTEDAVAAWCAAREVPIATLAQVVPVGRNDLLRRIASIEVTAGVNHLCAALADELRRAGHAELVDARSLPLGGPAAARWWLPGVDGYGCLRAGRLSAPFLVVWDRAAAPDVHRRRRAGFWRREAAKVRGHWGRAGLPPLLIVCRTMREVAVWRGALTDQADGETPPLGAYFTTRPALREHGAAGPIWQSATSEAGRLIGLLGWGPEPPAPALPLVDVLADLEPRGRQRQGALGRWAAQHATTEHARARWQHASALALATRPGEQTLLGWIARHPLLAASDLAELLNEPAALIERQLERLLRCRVVAPVPPHQPMTTEGATA